MSRFRASNLRVPSFRVPVDGGELNVLRFGDGPNVVLAAHGITASAMAFGAIGRRLPADWQLVAPDLRGRGHSAALTGSGMRLHVRDLVAVVDHLGGAPVVLAGHSMGAYVAVLTAAQRPDLVRRLVLIDGGLPLPVPAGTDLDELLALSIGPALARLSTTFDSEDAYVEFFREHRGLGPYWNDDIEAYVRYDAAPVSGSGSGAGSYSGSGTGDGAVRSMAVEATVRVDGREVLSGGEKIGAALRALTVPTLVLTAPDGMFGEPPGFIPPRLVDEWTARVPVLRAELVDDTNHYTISLGPAAELVAARLTDPSSWLAG